MFASTESTTMRNLHITVKGSPHLPKLEKAHMQQQRPSAAINTFLKRHWAFRRNGESMCLYRENKHKHIKTVFVKQNSSLKITETKVRSLSQEDHLEEGMATHSSILAWRIPWAEKPGRTVHRVAISPTQMKQLGTHSTSPNKFGQQ